MTLLPSSDFGIRGHEGNAYTVNEVCAHPDCGRPSAHAHHCWPRSYLRGQPYEWVSISVGGETVVIGNRLGFCVSHHEMLTGEIGGYRARLCWEQGVMWWEDRAQQAIAPGSDISQSWWERIGPTSAQPPVMGKDGSVRTIVGIDEKGVHVHDHTNMGENEICPTCGHHKPVGRKLPKPGRVSGPVKEWVAAGDPEGAALLDEHVEDFAIVLGMSDWTKKQKRYHVTSIVFAWAQQHREEFIADVAEAAEKRLRK
jgi:hypothetical protein